MTRNREENASDLAHDDEARAAAEAFLKDGSAYMNWPRGILDETGLDEFAWRECLTNAGDFIGVEVSGDVLTLPDKREIDLSTLYDVVEKAALEEADQNLADITRVFGAPVLESANGSWHLIDTTEKADLATRVTKTAIGPFWNVTREHIDEKKEDSHDWLILVDEMGKGIVGMAALRDGRESTYHRMVADCHITGYRNWNAWTEYQGDIEAIAADRGLHVAPNHMGKPLPVVDEDTPEP